MKNLKQVLALGMAFSLTMSTMAGAAFSDQDSINKANTDAVELLTTLDVIQGFEDGSFRPEETVTRAQMAKMIYTIRNGGNDNADAYKSATTTFKDISGHWAEGYIKYLQNTGIIAGKSETVFDPDATVTTAEAMKMALVLGGYRADKANLTGATWFNNTVSLATTNQLTDDVYSAMNGDCTRQDAAQILANTLGMTAVQWSEFTQSFLNDADNGLALGGNKITVGYKWMDLTTYVGRLVSSGDLSISGGTAGNNQFTVDVDTKNDIAYTGNDITFKDGKDHTDLVGQEVKVLTGDKIDEVYGVYTTGTSKVVETTMDKIDVDSKNDKFKIDGTNYSVDYDGVSVFADTAYENGADTVFTSVGQAVSDKVKLIDWDNNGKYETAMVETVNVAEVTYVGTGSITVGPVGGRTSVVNNQRVFDNDEISAYEGIAKGDYVIITRDDYNKDNWKIEKSTVVTGTVDGVVKNERKVRVDGTWYTLANNKSGVPYELLTVPDTKDDFVNKDKVTLYVVGDIAYYAESTKGNDVNRSVAMVYDTNIKGGNWNSTAQAKIILPDGSKKTVDIDKINDAAAVDANNDDKIDNLTIGQMYYYTVNNSNEYSFTTLGGNVLAGYDGYEDDFDGMDSGENKYGGHIIADDAIVFALIQKNNGGYDAKVYTGKSVKDAAKTTDWGKNSTSGGALYETDNGFTYTRMMNIILPENAQISSATNYGYLVTDGTYSYNSEMGCYVMEYNYWNGTELVSVKEKTSANKTWAVKGTVISFANGDEAGLIKDVTDVQNETIEADKLTYASITGVRNQYVSVVKADGNTDQVEVASDVIIYYVNSDASKDNEIGVSGSGYDYVVQKDADGYYPINAGYVLNSDGKVKFMVIDVDGKLNSQNSLNVMPATSTAAQINSALEKTDVAINGNVNATGTTLDVPANRTLTVNGTISISAMPKLGSGSTFKADKIDASAMSLTAAQIETLYTYTDNLILDSVNVDGSTRALTTIASLTIPADKTLEVASLTVSGTGAVTVNGAFTATSGLTVSGGTVTVNAGASVAVTGNIAVEAGANVKVDASGKMTATGTVTNDGGTIDGNVYQGVDENGNGGSVYKVAADVLVTKVTKG